MTPFRSEYWRDQALKKTILTSRLKDPLAKAAMRRVSNHYVELAKQADGSVDALSQLLCLRPPFPDASLPLNEQ
jgi:hypothetical protein